MDDSLNLNFEEALLTKVVSLDIHFPRDRVNYDKWHRLHQLISDGVVTKSLTDGQEAETFHCLSDCIC